MNIYSHLSNAAPYSGENSDKYAERLQNMANETLLQVNKDLQLGSNAPICSIILELEMLQVGLGDCKNDQLYKQFIKHYLDIYTEVDIDCPEPFKI